MRLPTLNKVEVADVSVSTAGAISQGQEAEQGHHRWRVRENPVDAGGCLRWQVHGNLNRT